MAAGPPLAAPRTGFCVWFTGLSGAGKSTIARAVRDGLERGGRVVTLLDGDEVRASLSADLGYSRGDRDANVQRIAFVAREVVRHGGAVLVAAISPYRQAREAARCQVGPAFVEVFVDTPADVCERRDVKGLYARARRGELPAFTGVNDPYEAPERPDLVLDGASDAPERNAALVVALLRDRALLGSHAG